MANYYYAQNRGGSDNPQGLSVGTSTQSKDFELNVLTTNSPTKKDVIKFLRTVEQYILGNGVATAAGTGVDQLPL